MAMSFAELCEELHLSPRIEQESQIIALENWCLQNISQDLHVTGQNAERYTEYLALAKTFLDDFLAYIPQNLAQKSPKFGHLNAIQYAAEHGYDQFITTLPALTDGLINEGDINGMTALHKSATEGHLFTVHALLNKGANAAVSNKQKQFPIQSALFVPILHEDGLIERKKHIFMALFDSQPELIGECDHDGNTVLQRMASHGFDDIMAIVLQINPTLASVKNHASLYPVHTAILNQQAAALNQLLKIDGVAALRDSKKRVPLHYAARYGTRDMVEQCCLATNDINITDNAQKTPLIWAAKAKNQEALELLIQKGAIVTAADYEGYTILHHAVIAQNAFMVRWIVANTPDELLNQVDAEGHSPLFHAQNGKNRDIEEILLSNGAIDVQMLRY